ncbi:benzoate membrane transport protein [Actinacidiphila yanglinensis]|uniref:Benzoate membrane transport protein n=1 Tax=Actinacidiphila yanglinensis TaxID=310779 RepID=A0A1H6DY70_9ACTN|nr:benzoate/H(+) symporter BenE family transporter [Actinacidiphila yanglinensis]SEG90171.1 benzoate membrane transport protein [Actinacidiphila yanglinensis]
MTPSSPRGPAALIRAAAPPSAVAAGLVTVLVGVTSSAAVVLSAARAAGAGPAELASWMLALGVGLGATTIGLSLRFRVPVVTAWSTPGAALLATGLTGASMGEAVGAFLLSAVLILISGVTGWFARAMASIPVSLAAALLAGVLMEFGTGLFRAMHGDFAVTFTMFAGYLVARRVRPRYAVLVALLVGIAATTATGGWGGAAGHIRFTPAAPVFTAPRFDWQTLVGAGLPLYVVTMASQNLPGVAVLRNDGYDVPVSPLLGWTGAANAVLAPFGAFALNLAAISAAICTGPEAHPDRERRYLAAVWAGVFYLCVALFGGTIGSLLTAMPRALVLGTAGVGLLGTIGGSLHGALADDRDREAAVVTFLATASGVTLLGVGSAFWGLLAGVFTMLVARAGQRRREAQPVGFAHGRGTEPTTGTAGTGATTGPPDRLGA